METRLLKKQMTAAYQYSYVRLALNYYTFFETIAEEVHIPERIVDSVNRLNELLSGYFSGQDPLEGLLKLREDMTHEAEVMTSYADCFQIYEYVLNRLERKFKTKPDTGTEDEAFVRRLLEFVTETSESLVMNGRIKQIIGQLPIRLTKQKFFSLVMEGLSVYIGSSRENLRDMLYILRTESMTTLPKNMEIGHKELYELLEQFRHTDYRNMTGEGFEEAMAKLISASERLTTESGLYVMIQEIINDFCVLLFAGEDAVIDVKEEELYRSILTDILEKFRKEDCSFGEDFFFEKLTQLEGRQETYYERYLKIELPQEREEWNKDPDYVKALNVDRLLSGSSFAELIGPGFDSEQKQEDGSLVDRAYLETEAGAYLKELEDVFSGSSKQVVRAIMAKVLSDLPVYFNSIDEIQAYISGSLESCLDQAEKETCKELLEELMDDENKLV
ncbi:hypothetical protein [Lacrimispora sp. JR3]|uniref:hypothetical protein n=1 Tax=Lacrimispora sinapis TaxID=3111456 RepID=UPI003748B3C1